MITLDIPASGLKEIAHFVTDFSGTISEDGSLIPGIKEKLNALAEKVDVHILTSDTFGKARAELSGIKCKVHILDGPDHTGQKERYVLSLGADKVAALGNGNNDSRMLKAAEISIAVCLKEGCSVEALTAAQILVMSPLDAVDLLYNPKRLVATLRR